MSQRRAAFHLKINRVTVVRKFLFLGGMAEFNLAARNASMPKAKEMEFDDMETFEHTKCKPLSITLAVESKTRRILGIRVSQMSPKGLLVKQAKKYGHRVDKRAEGREELFRNISQLIENEALIKSDMNPHYYGDVKRFFPTAKYNQYKGRRGSIVGQGELKKIRFDPLFSLNHTCAKIRADVNRLFRRTWCTTKKPERLNIHLAIYADFHNQYFAGKIV